MTPDERARLLADVDRAWNVYQALVDRLTQSALERPNTVGFWSGKDVVTHIANWEEYCTGLIRRWDSGDEKRWSYEFDASDAARWDAWNEEHVAPLRSFTLTEVRDYAESAHRDLIVAAAQSDAVTADDLAGMTTEHYRVHEGDLISLRSWMERKARYNRRV